MSTQILSDGRDPNNREAYEERSGLKRGLDNTERKGEQKEEGKKKVDLGKSLNCLESPNLEESRSLRPPHTNSPPQERKRGETNRQNGNSVRGKGDPAGCGGVICTENRCFRLRGQGDRTDTIVLARIKANSSRGHIPVSYYSQSLD